MSMENTSEREVRLVLERQVDAWNRGDAAGYSVDVAEDCWFTNIIGQALQGKAVFEERHRQIFTSIFAGSTLKMEVLRFREVTGDVAMVEAKATVSNFRALPPGVAAGADGALHTRLLQVLEWSGAAWRVVAYHNVDLKTQEATG